MPYTTNKQSASVLDMKRLGKQRVETYQILRTLANQTKGWQNHPAVVMWRGYEHALIEYGVAMCDEWITRGYKDTCRQKILDMAQYFPIIGEQAVESSSLIINKREIRESSRKESSPVWVGDPRLHLSHQSNLLRKDFNYYSRHFTDVPDDLPYYWPVGVTNA